MYNFDIQPVEIGGIVGCLVNICEAVNFTNNFTHIEHTCTLTLPIATTLFFPLV